MKTHIPDPSISNQQQIKETTPQQLNYEDIKKKAEIAEYEQNTKLRREYAEKLFYFLVGWCIVLFVLIVGNSIVELIFDRKFINKWVLVTLAGGTTGNVIFVMKAIIEGLFGNSKN